MKKIFKIVGITLLIIITLLIAIPFAFQGQIKDLVKKFINNNLNAKVEFSDVSLSFLRSFPQAHVTVNDLVITNFEPFENETLASAKDIAFTMSVKELFKNASDDPIVVNSIIVDEALVSLKTDKFGNNNYDITKENPNTSTSNSFSFDIDDYAINNSAFTYLDEKAEILLHVTELNHEGHGTFSAETSELDTYSEANVSITLDSVNYLNSNPVKLDALIGMDLENQTYTFKENTGFINELPLKFQGYIKQLENSQEIDISFENPESSFKSFLAVIPKTYSKNIETVETTGDFKVKGLIKGISSEETIPNLDISISSSNASFKYPDLPKGISNITIDTQIKNETGKVEDTYVAIKTLNFNIDNDVFKSSATLRNLTENMLVNANLEGVLNLANLSKAYPIELETPLTGILSGKISSNFDLNAIETNAYERIKSSGAISITDFIVTSDAMVNPIDITSANMTFNPGSVTLNNFSAKTGNSDFNATGTIRNLLGFLLSDNTLKGEFNVTSNQIRVNDFMADKKEGKPSNTATPTTTEALKIPAFLECIVNAKASKVLYDNIELNNVSGTLYIKDQQASIENLKSSLFDGALALGGDVTTKTDVPSFNLSLNANDFDISKSFQGLDLLKNLAPIAKLLKGKLNSNINLSGNLKEDLSLDLGSVSGNALAELLTTRFDSSNSNLLGKLEGALNFIDFDELNLNDLKAKFQFADGKVAVQPFNLNYKDIGIEISGSHGFDNTMNYTAIFNVPAKYLGSEVNRLIGKIDMAEVNNLSIPVATNITGSFSNPNVKTDLTSGVKQLTAQLIELEKQKLLNQGKDKVTDLLGDIIGGNRTKTDSIKKQQDNTVKDVLGGIITSRTPKNDSIIPKDTTRTTKNVIKNVLGGILGGTTKTKEEPKETKTADSLQ